ncbi:sigma-70 family RNA polymerase sigma factor [Pseudoflavonifractor sp. AF19-9AC]|uniref:RNA polymerase sigma factor n=1 Tax=Pseudoflavonifractor sp. AF19-9AC TaxID=2292244 RepID=UPI000E4F780D|nr:sigma-70 family RNA polymerase sigma factor [Pseudoflavonifractor sp. AF19-9AC]RHR10568.1 sigma-70 family RNA polymerase sigma factor [Pseudoflavonifractor sp. AF19-9AC]
MEDSMIVELYWARSEQAIEESDRKYGRYCLSIARSIVELEEDAEECVNDTWLRSWNAMPPQRPGVLSAFFGKITRNLSLDRWRKNRAAKRGGSQVEVALLELEDCLPDRNTPERHLEAAETARVISDFLRTQPELDRTLFVRRYFHLESLAALEARFGLTEGQVKSRLHRTRKRLRHILEEEGAGL